MREAAPTRASRNDGIYVSTPSWVTLSKSFRQRGERDGESQTTLRSQPRSRCARAARNGARRRQRGSSARAAACGARRLAELVIHEGGHAITLLACMARAKGCARQGEAIGSEAAGPQ